MAAAKQNQNEWFTTLMDFFRDQIESEHWYNVDTAAVLCGNDDELTLWYMIKVESSSRENGPFMNASAMWVRTPAAYGPPSSGYGRPAPQGSDFRFLYLHLYEGGED